MNKEMSARKLESKIYYFEDMLLRSNNITEQLKLHNSLMEMRKQLSSLKKYESKQRSES